MVTFQTEGVIHVNLICDPGEVIPSTSEDGGVEDDVTFFCFTLWLITDSLMLSWKLSLLAYMITALNTLSYLSIN